MYSWEFQNKLIEAMSNNDIKELKKLEKVFDKEDLCFEDLSESEALMKIALNDFEVFDKAETLIKAYAYIESLYKKQANLKATLKQVLDSHKKQ